MDCRQYKIMIDSMIERIRSDTTLATIRNRGKDETLVGNEYVKGWDSVSIDYLSKKLREEVEEFLRLPNDEEAGDIAWIVCMILDKVESIKEDENTLWKNR